MAEYEDAGDYGAAGLEVPPAPWQYGGEGSGGGSSGFGDDGGTDSSAEGGSSGFGDSSSYSQGAGYAAMRDQYNAAGIGAGGTAASSGYPGMNSGLPPDNAGINFPIDYSPPPGMGTDTDMGNPFDTSPSYGGRGYSASFGGGGGGGSSYPRGPSIPPEVLRQFINLLRYGGVQRI